MPVLEFPGKALADAALLARTVRLIAPVVERPIDPAASVAISCRRGLTAVEISRQCDLASVVDVLDRGSLTPLAVPPSGTSVNLVWGTEGAPRNAAEAIASVTAARRANDVALLAAVSRYVANDPGVASEICEAPDDFSVYACGPSASGLALLLVDECDVTGAARRLHAYVSERSDSRGRQEGGAVGEPAPAG